MNKHKVLAAQAIGLAMVVTLAACGGGSGGSGISISGLPLGDIENSGGNTNPSGAQAPPTTTPNPPVDPQTQTTTPNPPVDPQTQTTPPTPRP